VIILLRGISGSGKSTLAGKLAEAFGGFAVAADDFFIVDGKYEWDASKLGQAHFWCQNMTDKNLSEGKVVIVHNILTSNRDLKPYEDLAAKHNVKLVSLVVEKRHDGENEHGVPSETLQKQAEKLRGSIKLI
jgi:predicted kinase